MINTKQKATRPTQILHEVTMLRMFETTKQITNFLRDEYGLASSVETVRPGEFIDVYLTNYRHDSDVETNNKLPEDKIAKAILKMFNEIHKNERLKALNVWPTEFGYTIVLDTEELEIDTNNLSENLLYYYYNENVIDFESDDTRLDVNRNMRETKKAILENKEAEEAALNKILDRDETKEKQKEETPVNKTNELEPIPEEIDELEKGVEIEVDETLEVDEVKEIEIDESNLILDNRFIWFFTVLDNDANELIGEIDNLDMAIDQLVTIENAAMLVAYPYIDPDPENDNVDLVFADNPGPTIIYDGEE